MNRNGQSTSRQPTDEFEHITAEANDLDIASEREPGEIEENSQANPDSVSQTQQSNSQSAVPNVPSQISVANAARRLVLESFVNDYRHRRRTRAGTYSAILKELEKEPELTTEEKEITFQLYSAEVDSTETRNRRLLSTARAQASSSLDPIPESPLPGRQTLASKQARAFKHRSGQSDMDSSSESEDEEPKKKKRLTESDMPWFKQPGDEIPGINPSCIETVELLRLFHKDIKSSKFFVSIAPGSPENIPPSQWEHILKGEPIDLDQIISAIHRIRVTEEWKARIGETDILLGPTEATRKVATASDWSTAWRRASRAVVFAFPHRNKELEDYAEYIENEFAAKNPSGHQRIILYDVAVRNLVRGGQQILLTDTHCFVSLYSAIVMPDGVQYSCATRKPQGRGKGESCNRFNNKGCNSPTCRYRHVCQTCGDPGHGKSNCRSTTKN